jgi:hypothetical protein
VSQQVDGGGNWNKLWDDYRPVTSSPASTASPDASAEIGLPATFAVVAGKSPDQEVLVTVTALKGGESGTPVVLTQAQVQAPSDRVAALWMVLAKACQGQVTTTGAEGEPESTCPSGQTCLPTSETTSTCASYVIPDSSTLPLYMAGDLDARPPDVTVGPGPEETDGTVPVGPLPRDSGEAGPPEGGMVVTTPHSGEAGAPEGGMVVTNPDSGEAGTVALIRCTFDAKCPTGQTCVGLFCQAPCTTDLDCPTNWSCDEYTGDGGGLGGKTCDPQCNPLSAQQPDSVHAACAPGESCDIFKSLSASSVFTDCVIPGIVATGGLCDDSSECVAGDSCLGHPGICLPYCEVGKDDCGQAGTCQEFALGYRYYVNGTQEIGYCQPTCSLDSDCPTNWKCIDYDVDGGVQSTCRPHCNPLSAQQSDGTHAACDPGQVCAFFPSANVPTSVTDCVMPGTVATGGTCTKVTDCVAGDTCLGDPGICRLTCRVGANDCGLAATCQTLSPADFDGTQQFGYCDQPCTTDSDCGGDELCFAGECRAPCSVDGNCAKNSTCDTITDNDGGVQGSLCIPHCNPLSPGIPDSTHVACNTSQTCVIYNDSVRQTSDTYCRTVQSTSGAGEACSSYTDCSVGEACVSYGTSTTSVCSEYCAVASVNCSASIPCVPFDPKVSDSDGAVQIGTCH